MTAYELRIYQIAPGKMRLIEDIFRELAAPMMPEYSIESVGYWSTPDESMLYYVVRHDRLDLIVGNWERFHADPRWQPGLDAWDGQTAVTDVKSIPLVGLPTLPPANVTANREAAAAYVDSFLNHHDLDACDRHLSSDLIQHNPDVVNGIDGEKAFARAFFTANPEVSVETKRMAASDDHVFMHSVLKTGPDDRGSAVVDVFRFENGRIAEHWDVIQPIPERTASGNPMV